MENYIVINGKKAELTEEQLKALGIEVKKKRNNPFNSDVYIHKCYHYIDTINGVLHTCFDDKEIDETFVNDANSFNDEDFAYQVYLHELLNRRLLKYAWDNEAEDYERNCNSKQHYYILFDYSDKVFIVAAGIRIYKNEGSVYFSKQKVAKKAIEEVIKPFMTEHPEFVW